MDAQGVQGIGQARFNGVDRRVWEGAVTGQEMIGKERRGLKDRMGRDVN